LHVWTDSFIGEFSVYFNWLLFMLTYTVHGQFAVICWKWNECTVHV